jgi:hypothetical protein
LGPRESKATALLRIARARGRLGSALLVALAQNVAHHFPNDGGNILTESTYLALKAVEPLFQAVEPLIVTVKARFDRREIVAVAPSLFENVPGDGLLTVDLALVSIAPTRT